MPPLPNDLKSVKKRIRAWRVFARIAKCALITWTVLCFLCIIGYFGLSLFVLTSFPSQDGINPLPPARPSLRYARAVCIRDVSSAMKTSIFEASREDYTCFYSYSDIRVTIEQEYDYNPVYVFYGRVQMSKPVVPPSFPFQDAAIPVRQTDFFFVNRFNPYQAEQYRGKGSPEHYDWIHLMTGFDSPVPPPPARFEFI